MQKKERQETILNLISARPISRQDELAKFLRKNGFSVTQASISRDLDELGIEKTNGVYTLPPEPVDASIFGHIGAEPAGDNLIVVKCGAGLASAAAVRIDAAGLDGIAGTIAGDDTIFVAVKNAALQKELTEKLMFLLNE